MCGYYIGSYPMQYKLAYILATLLDRLNAGGNKIVFKTTFHIVYN